MVPLLAARAVSFRFAPRLRGVCWALLWVALALPVWGGAAESAAPSDEPSTLVWDPWEPMNRGIFAFNEKLDLYVLEPAGKGWNFVVPTAGQECISNFFSNLVMPVRMANDLLQLKPVQAIHDFFRLFANTALGVGGCFDVASRGGIPKYGEDFGLTLGTWGVPAGPYLVLPFFGPSNPRDGFGLLVDSAGTVHAYFISFPILAGAFVTNAVNERALNLDDLAAERASALDFYSAVRGAYVQFRAGKLRGSGERGEEDAALDDDLYYFDEDEDDE